MTSSTVLGQAARSSSECLGQLDCSRLEMRSLRLKDRRRGASLRGVLSLSRGLFKGQPISNSATRWWPGALGASATPFSPLDDHNDRRTCHCAISVPIRCDLNSIRQPGAARRASDFPRAVAVRSLWQGRCGRRCRRSRPSRLRDPAPARISPAGSCAETG